MQWLRQGLALILTTVAVAVGALFALQNAQTVPLDLIVIELSPQPIAIWVLLALASGVLIGLSVRSSLALRRVVTIRQLKKQRDCLLSATEKGNQNASQ